MWCVPAAVWYPVFEFMRPVRYIERMSGASGVQIGRIGQENHYECSH